MYIFKSLPFSIADVVKPRSDVIDPPLVLTLIDTLNVVFLFNITIIQTINSKIKDIDASIITFLYLLSLFFKFSSIFTSIYSNNML